ncbi:MAG: CvpA family protein [Desulfobacteraceae bacterium]|nr:CvpA family protein [Desulfobacteraceae bacterium]
MNFFDIAIIIIISFCLVRGVFRGILSELASIVGVVAGFYGAYNYYSEFTPLLQKWIESEALINIIVFFVLFCLILASINVIAIVLEKALKVAFLGWIDKTFGAVFGALKGVLVTAVVYIILTTFIPKDNALISQSILSPYVARVSSAMTLFISKNMTQGVMEKFESMGKIWKS